MPLLPKGLMPTPIVIGARGGTTPDTLNFSQNLISVQNRNNLFGLLILDSWSFDVTEGFGNGTTAVAVIAMITDDSDRAADMVVEIYLKVVDATVPHFGVMARITDSSDANYYWSRITLNGAQPQFRIAKTVAGVTTTLSTSANITINNSDIIRLKITVSGTSISGEYENITTASGTTTKSATDSDITKAGYAGFRSGITASKVWFRSVTAVAT